MIDEKTFTAIDIFGNVTGTDTSGTANFLKLILRLWKFLNVKSTYKGHRKRDSDMNPICGISDENVMYLNEVFNWLVKCSTPTSMHMCGCICIDQIVSNSSGKWEGMQQKVRHGRLSNETLFVLKHAVSTFTELQIFV